MTTIIENKPTKWQSNKAYRDRQYKYYSALIKCDLCNVEFCRGHKTRHVKSRQHLKLLQMKEKILSSISNVLNSNEVQNKNA